MSLAHPMIEPQMALRACTGYFFGGEDRYVAILYSNRIVFKLIDDETHLISSDSADDVVISIPQPPMTMGNPDLDILPNLGGVFVAVGRNRDMLAMQFKSALVFLSVNAVDQVLELQGCWGLSKLKDTTKLYRPASSSSIVSYVDHHHPHIPKMMRPGVSPRTSSSTVQTLSSMKGSNSGVSGGGEDHPPSMAFTRLNLTPPKKANGSSSSSLFTPHTSLSRPDSSSSLAPSTASSTASSFSGRSGLSISPALPRPVASPEGTQIFLVTKNKGQSLYMVLLSSFGQELIKSEVDYINVLTLGWISDDMVYIVYLNQNFHKKFQTFRLGNKLKSSGIFGMGRKSSKPSFIPEINVPLALDFQPSIPDTSGGPDLVFKDYVLLGTKAGGYVRVNYKSSSWVPVLNAKNVLGSVWVDDRAVVIQSSVSNTSPCDVSQLSYSIISESAVHALKVDPSVGACLCSKHNIDGDHRFALKLLYMGNGIILDYKRAPFRALQFCKGRNVTPLRLLSWNESSTASLSPCHGNNSDGSPGVSTLDTLGGIARSTKITQDFLVKTEMALYTRDVNGDDCQVCKILDRDTIFAVPVGRIKLLKLLYRDVKSVWAIYEDPAEIRVLDESHSKPMKFRKKASYIFPEPYTGWRFKQILPLFRNVLLLNMTMGDKWATFLVSFVNSTHKTNPSPPQVSLIMESQAPESPPTLFKTPGNPSKVILLIFDKTHCTFTRQFALLVSSSARFNLEQMKGSFVPTALDESENVSFFTELDGPLDGLYLAGLTSPPPKPSGSPASLSDKDRPPSSGNDGSSSPNSSIAPHSPGSLNTPFTVGDARIHHVLTVEAPDASSGLSIVLPHKDYHKSTLWIFDSDSSTFRELTVQEVPVAKYNKLRHCEHLFQTHQKLPKIHRYELSPDFAKFQFVESSRNNQFRPLPELNAIISRGIGSGLDAEVYLKTPDSGVFAIFRIQNKRLLESLARLERVVLEKKVGVWLPDELRAAWLSDFQDSTMIAGSAFSAFWQLNDEQQKELCDEANVDIELMRKIRPP